MKRRIRATPAPSKPTHMAKLVSDLGVSPLCADTPKAIDLKRATWTNRPEAVDCPKCLIRLKTGT